MQKIALTLLLLLLVSGCLGFGSETKVILNQPFSLKINQTAYLASEDLTIHLREINDSRCPSDVVCVWAGEALAKIEIGKGGTGALLMMRLEEHPQAVEFLDAYTMELISVDPYPSTANPLSQSDYNVTLKVRRKA